MENDLDDQEGDGGLLWHRLQSRTIAMTTEASYITTLWRLLLSRDCTYLDGALLPCESLAREDWAARRDPVATLGLLFLHCIQGEAKMATDR